MSWKNIYNSVQMHQTSWSRCGSWLWCQHPASSVAFQLAPAGRLSVINLSLKYNLPMFWLNAPVVVRAKVKKCLMCNDDWSIQSKHWQVIFWAQVGSWQITFLFTLPDSLINPGENEPLLPTREKHTATGTTKSNYLASEDVGRLTPIYV